MDNDNHTSGVLTPNTQPDWRHGCVGRRRGTTHDATGLRRILLKSMAKCLTNVSARARRMQPVPTAAVPTDGTAFKVSTSPTQQWHLHKTPRTDGMLSAYLVLAVMHARKLTDT